MEIAIAFILAAFLVETLATVAGFGTSVLLLPVALFFFDFRAALAIVALFHIMSGVIRLAFFGKLVDRKLLFLFGLPGVIGAIIGAFVAAMIPQQPAQLVFGVLLSAYAAYSLFVRLVCFGSGRKECVAGGGISGFLSGAVGVGGAPLSAFLCCLRLENRAYVGTAAAIMLAINLARAPIYAAEGFLPSLGASEIGLLLLAALAGAAAGMRLSHRLDKETVRRIVLVALFVAGILIAA
jgi:uncharacterized protein